MLQMYDQGTEAPSLWDLGTGHTYTEYRTIPVERPHIQMTCRSCGAARWYMHRNAPLSANPVPVFSIVSPLWDNARVEYERVRPATVQPPRDQAGTEGQVACETVIPEMIPAGGPHPYGRQGTQPELLNNLHIQEKIQEPIRNETLQNSEQAAPINCLSVILDPFTYAHPENQAIETNQVNCDNYSKIPDPVMLPPVIPTMASVELDSNIDREINKPIEIMNQKFDGHKHLRGSTTWTPVMKRGRQKSSHHHKKTKIEKSIVNSSPKTLDKTL